MADSPPAWNKFTVAELKDELRERGLSVKGLKSELLARLESESKKDDGENGANDDVVQGEDKHPEGQEVDEVQLENLENEGQVQLVDDEGQGQSVDDGDQGQFVGDQEQGELVDCEGQGEPVDDDGQGQSVNHGVEDPGKPGDFEGHGEKDDVVQGEDKHPGQPGDDEGQDEPVDDEDKLLKDDKDEPMDAEDITDMDDRQAIDLDEIDQDLKTLHSDMKSGLHEEDTGEEQMEQDGNESKEQQLESTEQKMDEGDNDSVIILDDSEEEGEVVHKDKDNAKIESPKESQDKKKTSTGAPSKQMPPLGRPMKMMQFTKWVGQRIHMIGRERALFVSTVTSKDDLCLLLKDWAPKCAQFQILYGRDGKGGAFLRFYSHKMMQRAKEALQELFGADRILQLSDLDELEHAVENAVNVCFKSPDLASRTIVVQGIPRLTREEEILKFFPQAKLIIRPVKKRDFKVDIPPDLGNHYFIEFSDAEVAQAAIYNSKNMTSRFGMVVVKSMRQYLEEFKEWERGRSRVISMEQDYESQLLSDEERIRLCNAFKQLSSQWKASLKTNNYELEETLKKDRAHLQRILNDDTDRRRILKRGFPEPEEIMTPYTLGEARKLEQPAQMPDTIACEDMDLSADEEEEPEKISYEPAPPGVEEDEISETSHFYRKKLLEGEIEKLRPDQNGNYTLSMNNDGKFTEKVELLQRFGKYGNIVDMKLTKKRGFVSFGTKVEAVRMLTDLLGDKEWSVAVPTTSQKPVAMNMEKPPPRPQVQQPRAPGSVFYQMFVGGKTTTSEPYKMPESKPIQVNVSNINTTTKLAKLRLFMSQIGPIVSVKLEKWKKDKTTLTAVVTFKDEDCAMKALAKQNLMLDGKKLLLTSGSCLSAPPHLPLIANPDSLQDRQVIARELNPKSDQTSLEDYFSKFGEIVMCHLFCDNEQRSKCFALLTFKEEKAVREVLKYHNNRKHFVDGKSIVVAPQTGSIHAEEAAVVAPPTNVPSLMSQKVQIPQRSEVVVAKSKKTAPSNLSKEEQVALFNRQMFPHKLNPDTMESSLEEYFSRFGKLEVCQVIRDKKNKSRGFAKITYEDEYSVREVLRFQRHNEHFVDGRVIRVSPHKESKHNSEDTANKKAPRPMSRKKQESWPDRQVFVHNLKQSTTERSLKTYFSRFGEVSECFLFCDKAKRSRGFAQITFEEVDPVEDVLNYDHRHRHCLDGKYISVTKQCKIPATDNPVPEETPVPVGQTSVPTSSRRVSDERSHPRISRFDPAPANIPGGPGQLPKSVNQGKYQSNVVQIARSSHPLKIGGRRNTVAPAQQLHNVANTARQAAQPYELDSKWGRVDKPSVHQPPPSLPTAVQGVDVTVPPPPSGVYQQNVQQIQQPQITPQQAKEIQQAEDLRKSILELQQLKASLLASQPAAQTPASLLTPMPPPPLPAASTLYPAPPTVVDHAQLMPGVLPRSHETLPMGSMDVDMRRQEQTPRGMGVEQTNTTDKLTKAASVVNVLKSLHEALNNKREDLSKQGKTKTDLTSALHGAVLQGFQNSSGASTQPPIQLQPRPSHIDPPHQVFQPNLASAGGLAGGAAGGLAGLPSLEQHGNRPGLELHDLLRQQEILRKETLKQQQVIQQQEQQLLQHQQEELQLQKELLQLRQMKEAALRETMMLKPQFRK